MIVILIAAGGTVIVCTFDSFSALVSSDILTEGQEFIRLVALLRRVRGTKQAKDTTAAGEVRSVVSGCSQTLNPKNTLSPKHYHKP